MPSLLRSMVILALVAGGCDDASSTEDGGPASGMDGGMTADGGGMPSDSGRSNDAGGGGADAGPGTDAGPPAPGEVACASISCDAATQECCLLAGSPPMCVADPMDCTGGLLECDGPEDCGSGEICCTRRGDPDRRIVGCVPDTECMELGDYEVCRSPTDCRNPTDMCCRVPVPTAGELFVCQDMCPSI